MVAGPFCFWCLVLADRRILSEERYWVRIEGYFFFEEKRVSYYGKVFWIKGILRSLSIIIFGT